MQIPCIQKLKLFTIILGFFLFLPLLFAGFEYNNENLPKLTRSTITDSRFDNLIGNCTAGNFVFGVDANGFKLCDAPAGAGDITSVIAGIGLIGGGDSGDVTLNWDTNYFNETDPHWTSNYTKFNDTWVSTFNSTYDSLNDSGFIMDWNASLFIMDWNASLFIIDWNSSSFIIDWNASNFIIDWNSSGLIINWSGDYLTEEFDPHWTSNYTKFNDTWSSTTNTSYYLISSWNTNYSANSVNWLSIINTSYYLESNPYSYWNNTFATFNKTYADILYVDVKGDSMTGNLNMSNNKIYLNETLKHCIYSDGKNITISTNC